MKRNHKTWKQPKLLKNLYPINPIPRPNFVVSYIRNLPTVVQLGSCKICEGHTVMVVATTQAG